jgi:hypothetical protein
MMPLGNPEVTNPLSELLIGLVFLTLVILAHGVGVRLVYRRFNRAWASSVKKPAWHHNLIVAGAIASLAALHLAATFLWAWPIWRAGLIPSLRDSYFFVLENYTTLGDDVVSLPKSWRLIGPLIAISGLFNVGWTASVFVNMMHEIGQLDRAEAHKQ